MQSKTEHTTFFNCLTKDVWTIAPENNKTTISHEPVYLSSLHPYLRKCKYSEKIVFKNAFSLRVIFDTRCDLEDNQATLTFYKVWWFIRSSWRLSRMHDIIIWLLDLQDLIRRSIPSQYAAIACTTRLNPFMIQESIGDMAFMYNLMKASIGRMSMSYKHASLMIGFAAVLTCCWTLVLSINMKRRSSLERLWTIWFFIWRLHRCL